MPIVEEIAGLDAAYIAIGEPGPKLVGCSRCCSESTRCGYLRSLALIGNNLNVLEKAELTQNERAAAAAFLYVAVGFSQAVGPDAKDSIRLAALRSVGSDLRDRALSIQSAIVNNLLF